MNLKIVMIWDWPVRVGHWLLASAFALAWLTSESEAWRNVHVLAGGAVAGVVGFRLLWGIAGTRYARFSDFVCGPNAVASYMRSITSGAPAHFTGHNPAGGWAIVGLLVLAALTAASGWLTYQELGGEFFEEGHEIVATAMLGLVLVHLAGVLVGSVLHRENLARAMITGRKLGEPGTAIVSGRPLVALSLLLWVGYCAWWFAR